jgi:abequosyltransferase
MERTGLGQTRKEPRRTAEISVGIPAYSRCPELVELMQSIYAQTVLPAEITICEDKSPKRAGIRAIVDAWRERFAAESCNINYHENEYNLGYDGNLRRVIEVSHSAWVMLMGNDDLLLPQSIETAARYIYKNPQVRMISRSFIMFENDIQTQRGIARLSSEDQIFSPENASPGMIFRTSGFVGGLMVHHAWASTLATDRYDGSLYYQIYLASVAFCQGGVGYISKPIVGARMGNPPLFGSAATEKGVHVPGSYTPQGRANMWASVLRIAEDVGKQTGVNLYDGMRTELEVRQSFHIFEMMAGSGRQRLAELRDELKKLGLFSHPLPRTLFIIDSLLGSKAKLLYRAVRGLWGGAGRLHASLAGKCSEADHYQK